MKPRVFIASSKEQLDLAYAVQENLEHDAEVTVWTQGVFLLSRSTIASLVDQLDEADFGVFVLAPDDVALMRTKTVSTVRDNVIFDLGLFAGRLGHERCYLIVPRGEEDLHLPTDLLGLTPASFDADRQDENLAAALGPACNRIRKSMRQLGPFARGGVASSAQPPTEREVAEALTDDPNDCLSLIQSWMGQRPMAENRGVIRFDDVDRTLRLTPGSARKYIKQAAAHYSYVVAREGKDTILFTQHHGRA